MNATTTLTSVQQMFDYRIDEEQKVLTTLNLRIQNDKVIERAFLDMNRGSLLDLAEPYLNEFKQEHRMTHLYFMSEDETCFLRVHKPSKFGDIIIHKTAVDAFRTDIPTGGLELGKYGMFTLRVVHPWMRDGHIIGYIETGMEIEHITEGIAAMLNINLAVAINKSFLNQPLWETGQQILGHTYEWNSLKSYAVVDRTTNEIPEQLDYYLNISSNHDSPKTFMIDTKEHKFIAGLLPLIDFSKQKVGSIIVMDDSTVEASHLWTLTISLIAFCLFICAIIFTLFYIYLGKIEKKISQFYNDLRNEVNFRISTEDELRHTLLSSADIVREIPSGLFIYKYQSPDSLILIDGNPEAEKLTGKVISEIKGMHFDEIWPSAKVAGITDIYIKVAETGEHYDSEDTQYADDVLQGAFRTRVFKLPGSRLAVAFENITARMKAELESEHLRLSLAKAEKMKTFGIMAGGVAHDLNNTLGPLIGYPELIMSKLPKDSDAHNQLQHLRDSALDVASVMQDLLIMSHRDKQQKLPLDMNQIISESIASEWFTSLNKKNEHVSLEINLAASPIIIDGADTHLNRFVENIIAHAFDVPSDSTEITISTEELKVNSIPSGYDGFIPGDYLLFKVSRTGDYIDSEDFPRIFEPYFCKYKLQGKSSGLGLPVVYTVIKEHNAFYDIVPIPPRGAIFQFYFPLSSANISRINSEQTEVTAINEPSN